MNFRFFLLYGILLLSAISLSAQSVKELESRRKQALQNLSITNKMLNETSKSKQSSVNKISILKQNINQRQELISTMNQELVSLDKVMDTLQTEKKILNNRLNLLKEDYVNLVREAHYQQKSLSAIVFIFSAKDFNQMYRRLGYLQEFRNYRKRQLEEIKETSEQLNEKEAVLMKNKQKKSDVIRIKQYESRQLESDRMREGQMLEDLKLKEKKLREQQKQQQKQANELSRKIQELVNAEIQKEKKKQKNNKSSTSDVGMTKQEALIAGNFEKNKGRLPWPVEKGFVSGKFGIQKHPVLEHVTMHNKGVYIQTNAFADARAVFEGVVSQCFSIPGSNKAVIIKHGNYRSVYTNLQTLYVKEGDKISAKQKIGKIFVDEENDNKTEMLLMIYLGTQLQDPELWLAK